MPPLSRMEICAMSEVNWFGWDLPTIAAVYESNKAAKECVEGLVNIKYVNAAAQAEADLDPRYKTTSIEEN
jgi:hypothetical protein